MLAARAVSAARETNLSFMGATFYELVNTLASKGEWLEI
jgi:hypothetical protein